MKVKVVNPSGKKVEDIELNEAIFGIKPNEHVVHQVVTAQLTNSRKGSASTKNRSAVRGGGAKPWRQKGTGRARAGSNRSPLWVGGGTVFGPHPKKYRAKVNKKVKRLAFKSVFSSRVQSGNLIVVSDFGIKKKPETKKAAKVLKKLKAPESVTVLLSKEEKLTYLSVRNISGVSVVTTTSLNLGKLLSNQAIVATKPALLEVNEVLSK